MTGRWKSLSFESLEARRVLAAAVLQNPTDCLDVDQDGQRTLQDGLTLVRFLSDNGSMPVGQAAQSGQMVDVNGDNFAGTRDILDWINDMAEGEHLGPAIDAAIGEAEDAALDASSIDVMTITDLIDQQVATTEEFVDSLVASQRQYVAEVRAAHGNVSEIQSLARAEVAVVQASVDEYLADTEDWLDEVLGSGSW